MLGWLSAALSSTVVSPSRDTAYLTGLRGYAAFAVIAIHTGLGGVGVLGGFFVNLVNHGKHGVPLFFVLSGYTIALSIYKQNGFSYVRYWRRRCSRILPLYFGLIIFLFLIGYEGSYWAKELDAPNDFFSLIAHVFFLNVYLSQYANNIVGVEWSIPVEFFYYTIIPSMAFLARRPFGVVLLCVFAYLFSRLGSMLPSPFADGSQYDYLKWGWQPFRYAWCFVLGVCLASVSTYMSVVKRIFERPILTVLVLIVFVVYVYSVHEGGLVFYTLVSCGLIITSGKCNKVACLLFENKIALYMGNVSFSLYLLHYPIMEMMYSYSYGNPQARFAVYMVVLLGLTTLSYVFIEYPFFHRKTGQRALGL